ncbi:MAG: hypothetical protein JWP01_3953 [Myxococcales bacterium]|nr:hypothetical protein [Myxococcales bacterium]
MKVSEWRAVAAAISFCVIACNKDPKCVTGESVACACSTGATGAQVCRASGTFEPCVCTTPSTPPAHPVTDAMGPRDAGTVEASQPAIADGRQPDTAKKPVESWYRRCVKQGIQDHIRRYGSRSDLKGAEETAIFACEATMGCSGQRDCDAKAARSAKSQRDTLNKWK